MHFVPHGEVRRSASVARVRATAPPVEAMMEWLTNFWMEDGNMIGICIYIYIYGIYLEPVCPLFLGFHPPKQGLCQSKQVSFGFQVHKYIYIESTRKKRLKKDCIDFALAMYTVN